MRIFVFLLTIFYAFLSINTSAQIKVEPSANTNNPIFFNKSKVGVGTSNPYGLFTLRGVGRSLVFDLNSTSVNSSASIDWNCSNSDLGVGKTSVQIAGIREVDGALGSLTFSTRGTTFNLMERMRINSLGNVGIGTSNPQKEFQVVAGKYKRMKISLGSHKVQNGSFEPAIFLSRWTGVENNYQSYILHSLRNNVGYGLSFSCVRTHDDNDFSNYSTTMYLSQLGDVGIGMTMPTEKLDINGNLKTKRVALFEWSNPSFGYTNSSIAFSGIRQDGEWKVYGDRARSTIGVINMDIFSNIRFLVHRDDSFSGGKTLTDEELINKNTKMIFDYLGNVGIGTTDPQTKLDVAGTIRAIETKEEAQPACFVINENYAMSNL